MRLFRNPIDRTEFLCCVVIALAASIACMVINPVCGLIVLGAFVLVVGVIYACAVKRNRVLAELSERIDFLLHNEQAAFDVSHKEGDLYVLESEILKMTRRIRENTEALKEDKIRLTHAIEDIFHQLRTPLTSMTLSVSMMAEEEISYDERIKYARDIKKQISRATWLVEALLKMSKLDAGTVELKKEPLKVRHMLIKATESLLIPLEVRGIDLKLNIEDESFTGDIDWTAEAIGNIIKNCMEHTPAEGLITVSARETNIFTEIDIEDSGEGFLPEDIPHLFERFYKGKNSSKESYGIGLALSKMIVNSQNGTVKALNAKNGGARFEIKFYKSVV